MISIESVLAMLASHVYLVVLVGTFIDATGTPFPGRLLLITAGGLAAAGDVSVPALIALSVAGAVAGDHAWYLAGRLAGGRVTRLYCRFVMRGAPGCAERAHAYLARFGAAAVFMGRFMAGVRILVTPLAAESGMPYLRYVSCDVAGALVWCGLWVLVGFGLGDQWMTSGGTGPEVMVGVLGTGCVLLIALTLAVRLIGTRRAETKSSGGAG